MPVDHWMMFATFKDQGYFTYPSKETYAGAVINANMVAHAPGGLAGFLLEKTAKQIYIIDPMTHAFQHDPSALKTRSKEGEEKVKASIKTLSESYGEPIRSKVGTRPLTPKDFESSSVLEEFTRRCVAFQELSLSVAMKESDSIKYFPELSDEELKPYAVIAPYFYMSETTIDRWLDLNVKAAKMAVEQGENRKVFASIVVSQGVILSEDRVKEICENFSDIRLDGFLLWVDNLNEQEAGEGKLQGLLNLARGLRGPEKDREVINLHGGYFSVLAAGALGNGAFSGVTHGPEFGEHRAVVPVGGGIPIARYYLPLLHSRIRYRDALGILNAKDWLENARVFHQNVCSCAACKETLDGNSANFTLFGESNVKEIRRGKGIVRMEYPTRDAQIRCLTHYLQQKSIEYQRTSTDSPEQLLNDLMRGAEELEDVIGLDRVAHLHLWEKVLTS